MCLESPTGVRYIFPNDIVPQGNRLAKKRTVQSRDWRLLLQCRAAGGSDLGVGGRAAPRRAGGFVFKTVVRRP